uniref:F-box domain-containing protein n=1 Tax=Caenorhabditis tropicalis TaxID=1561998 RepID=A0A1I7T2T4_9PELO
MPDVVMRRILKECDFVSIVSLQKTCHTLRNFIDDTKPEPRIDQIQLSGSASSISLVIFCGDNWEKYPKGQKIQLDYNNPSQFKLDFQKNFGFRRSVLPYFFLNFPLDTVFLEVLKYSIPSAFRVETFCMSALDQSSILLILPLLCPKTLKYLEITGIKGRYDRMEIDGLVKLEQWKRATSLNIKRVPVSAKIQEFEHFSIAKVFFEEVTMDDLMFLRKKFLNPASTSEHFQLFYSKIPNQEPIIQEFGEPFEDRDQFFIARGKRWFFKRNEKELVEIGYFPSFLF